jgi:hypothetical protein
VLTERRLAGRLRKRTNMTNDTTCNNELNTGRFCCLPTLHEGLCGSTDPAYGETPEREAALEEFALQEAAPFVDISHEDGIRYAVTVRVF